MRVNVPSYNTRLYELKWLLLKGRYETIAICKRLTHIYYIAIYDIYECIYL